MGKESRWKPLDRYSSWRKISMGMWNGPGDPTILGYETLVADDALEYIERVSAISGVKVSMTALIVKMVANILTEFPELNVVIVNGRVMQRESVDIFCQVAVPGNAESGSDADLSGVKLVGVDKMDVVDVAKVLRKRATRVRKGEDEEIEKQKSQIDKIPRFMMRNMVRLLEFLTFNVPFDLDKVGVKSDPFGSVMVSSVASFDIRLGFAPLVPASRCPIVFLPGAIFDDVRVVDGEIKKCKVMQMSMTADHRAFDGLQIGHIVRGVRYPFENILDHFPPVESYAHHKSEEPNTPPTPEDERNGRRG